MSADFVQQRQQARFLVEILPEDKLAVAVGVLEAMVNIEPDAVSQAIANAPFDDEVESADERISVASSKAWLSDHPGQGTTHEQLMAEFGLFPGSLSR